MNDAPMISRILTLIVVITLAACATEPTKQSTAQPVKPTRSGSAVTFEDLELATAKGKDNRYGVLLGVFATRMDAQVQAEAYEGALSNVGLLDVPYVSLLVKDEHGRDYYVAIAGQYGDLEPAYYLQNLITRAVPGQYNLVVVPKAVWVR